MKVAAEVGVASILLFAIPAVIVKNYGYPAMMYALAITILLLGSFVTKLRSPVRHAESSSTPSEQPGSTLWVLLGLAGLFLYFAGQTAEWAFLGKIGLERGVDGGSLGAMLGFMKFLGALGSITTAIIGVRYGRLLPVLLSFLMFYASVGFLLLSEDEIAFFIGGSLFEYSWGVTLAYLMGVIAVTDRTGKLVGLIPAMLALGGTLGPTIAGQMLDGTGYKPVLVFTCATSLIGSAVFVLLILRLKQPSQDAGPN